MGAGFYLDATQSPWNTHWRMESYVTQELPALLAAHLPLQAGRLGVFGHSMGGHGALTIGTRNADAYRSISAFAPISSASRSANSPSRSIRARCTAPVTRTAAARPTR